MLLAPIAEIFCDIDDFCKTYSRKKSVNLLPCNTKKTRNRSTLMSESDVMTILVLFHLSHYRTFKDFYLSCVLEDLSALFPKAVSYNRFVERTGRVLEALTVYVLSK